MTNDLDLTSLDVFYLVLEDEPHNPLLKDITALMLHDATASDPVLPKLCDMMIEGWPGSKDMVPKELVPYWNFRDELSIMGGVLYKQHQCVVPQSLQSMMLYHIHTAHAGAASNLRLAKKFLFWPGMVKTIEDMCNMCGMCAQYTTATPRALMKSLPIPRVPFEIVRFIRIQMKALTCHSMSFH